MSTILNTSQLNSWKPGTTYESFSQKDWQNWHWQQDADRVANSKEIRESLNEFFPVSRGLQDFINEKITNWNAFEKRVQELLEGVDESEEDDDSPWMPGEFYLPLDNPKNSTDYQDDFDPQDFAAESWESEDVIDDHHTDPYLYSEVAMSENPVFNEDGSIEWENQSDADLDSPGLDASEFVKRVMENLFDADIANPYFFHSEEARDQLTEFVNENLEATDLANSDLTNQNELIDWTLTEMQIQATKWESESFS